MDHQHRPIPLYPYPPLSSSQTRVESVSGEDSEFPPIRERNSTPDLSTSSVRIRSRRRHSPVVQRLSEQRSSPSEEPGPSQSQHHPPNTGLGNKNRVNTIRACTSVRRAKIIPKSSLKRDTEALEVADERPSKKQRITSTPKDNMDWLKREISDVKKRTKVIAEHLRGDVDFRLEELLWYVRVLAER